MATDDERLLASLRGQVKLLERAGEALARNVKDLEISLQNGVFDDGPLSDGARKMRRVALMGISRHASYVSEQVTLTALSE